MSMDPGLDLPHGDFDDPATVENYQWLAMDDTGVGLICHLGTVPGDGTLWHTLSAVSLPSGEVYVAKAVGRPGDERSAGTPLNGVRCKAPFETWRFHADAGFQVIYAATAPDNAAEVLRLVGEQLGDLKDRPVSERELQDSRENLTLLLAE